jgi:hypothetical protein
LAGSYGQQETQSAGLLSRRYQPGEQLNYLMKASNNGRRYEVRLTAVVKELASGQFVEEYTWSDLVVDGVRQPLTAASRDFRQIMTLTGDQPFKFPDLSKVQPALIGPITDLLTFYADLFLAMHAGRLHKPGDRFLFPSPGVSSWADGTRVIAGEDAIDFDIRLTDVNSPHDTAMLLVKHVPPATPKVKIHAEWMREPIADVPNNWMQVRRTANGYIGAAGKETFDVELHIRLSNGEILSATMDNRVEAVERECRDVALSNCSEPRQHRITRRIELSRSNLERQ